MSSRALKIPPPQAGWVITPQQPTAAQFEAARRFLRLPRTLAPGVAFEPGFLSSFKAMLAAAPKRSSSADSEHLCVPREPSAQQIRAGMAAFRLTKKLFLTEDFERRTVGTYRVMLAVDTCPIED